MDLSYQLVQWSSDHEHPTQKIIVAVSEDYDKIWGFFKEKLTEPAWSPDKGYWIQVMEADVDLTNANNISDLVVYCEGAGTASRTADMKWNVVWVRTDPYYREVKDLSLVSEIGLPEDEDQDTAR